ncbi:MAG: hypothetical protein WBM17_14355 [Anaerolineales bacterium]
MSRIADYFKEIPKRFLAILEVAKPLERKGAGVLAFLILGVWLSGVVFTESRHEFWRDEVRALSLARAAQSPADLYASVQYDGHPMLWHFLLYAGKSIVDSPLILPVFAVGIGFFAVAVFMFFAPFPLWVKCLFIFSALPFYEYSVMARNYGISMLLLFLIAILYRYRDSRGWLLVLLLILLANTNAHSVVFAASVAGIWAWDLFVERRATLSRGKVFSFGAGMVLLSAGILFSFLCFMPRENTILSPIRQTLDFRNIVAALGKTAFHPELTFDRLMPDWVPNAAVAAIFILLLLGLFHRFPLFVAALIADLAFGIFFELVYPGYYRHQGLFLVFAVFLYWLAMDRRGGAPIPRVPRWLFSIGAYVALPLIFLAGITQLRETAWRDIRLEMSSSKAFGEFLQDPSYRDAILLPEPDYLIESVAYYAKNDIYLPREGRFSKTVSWTTDSNAFLSMEELLATARDLQSTYSRPVLIVLGHTKLDFSQSGEEHYSYNKVFAWDARSAADFKQSTVLIADFHAALEDENYQIYAFRDKAGGVGGDCFRNGCRPSAFVSLHKQRVSLSIKPSAEPLRFLLFDPL